VFVPGKTREKIHITQPKSACAFQNHEARTRDGGLNIGRGGDWKSSKGKKAKKKRCTLTLNKNHIGKQ